MTRPLEGWTLVGALSIPLPHEIPHFGHDLTRKPKKRGPDHYCVDCGESCYAAGLEPRCMACAMAERGARRADQELARACKRLPLMIGGKPCKWAF